MPLQTHYLSLKSCQLMLYEEIITFCSKIHAGYKKTRGPGSVVGIATAYGLDGPGIESQWRRDFPHLSRPALRSTQPPVQWVPSLSRG
jgi:hypothetical protein